jgi:hypothetical protein
MRSNVFQAHFHIFTAFSCFLSPLSLPLDLASDVILMRAAGMTVLRLANEVSKLAPNRELAPNGQPLPHPMERQLSLRWVSSSPLRWKFTMHDGALEEFPRVVRENPKAVAKKKSYEAGI